MPHGRRKVPFSGKKKKEQLIAKRIIKKAGNLGKLYSKDSDDDELSRANNIQKIHSQPSDKLNADVNRFALQFHKESRKELLAMKENAYLPYTSVPDTEREVGTEYFDQYDFPTRPEWRYDMTKNELNINENRYFREYLQKLESRHFKENKVLSVFELNLETWRQLWRVLELSDIILTIVDVRYASLIFPPSLYTFISQNVDKKMILLLNKIDLVPPEVVVAWKEYFSTTYPELPIVYFASYPVCKSKGKSKRRRNMKVAREGAYEIFKKCREIVGNELDLTAWEQKILEDISSEEISVSKDTEDYSLATHKENIEFNFEKHVKYKDGILTIGCVGFPNVGKSSVINALKGRKVVSVSRTPGHTKHFQTIFLTNNVKLCDCPGLVFPSSVPKYIQAIIGSYPIAQLREPYCSIKFICERVDLTKILKIQLPSDFTEWSAIAVCEAWALKKGFLSAKAARPDHYRAANNILRMTLDGKITVEFFPPNYFKNIEKWESHPDLCEVKKIQSGNIKPLDEASNASSIETSSEDERNYEGEEDTEGSSSNSDDVANTANTFNLLEDE